jgi:hypothetical protein
MNTKQRLRRVIESRAGITLTARQIRDLSRHALRSIERLEREKAADIAQRGGHAISNLKSVAAQANEAQDGRPREL